MLLQNGNISFFLWLTNILLYTYVAYLIHSPTDRHLGCFFVLGIVNSAAMNIEVHVSFWIRVFSGYMVSGNFDLKNEFLPQESSSSLLLGKLSGSSPVQASETKKQSKPLNLLLTCLDTALTTLLLSVPVVTRNLWCTTDKIGSRS